MKQLLIADDHRLFAEGVQFLLSYSDSYCVADIVTNGTDVLTALHRQPIDMLVLDVTMPGLSGVEVAKLVRVEFSALPILAISMETEPKTVQAMLRAGANGYCPKTADQADLLIALATVSRGETYLSKTLNPGLSAIHRLGAMPAWWATLTPREQEVARLLVQGLSNAAIAHQTFTSPRTIETHRKNIYAKLHVHNAVELTTLLLKNP